MLLSELLSTKDQKRHFRENNRKRLIPYVTSPNASVCVIDNGR